MKDVRKRERWKIGQIALVILQLDAVKTVYLAMTYSFRDYLTITSHHDEMEINAIAQLFCCSSQLPPDSRFICTFFHESHFSLSRYKDTVERGYFINWKTTHTFEMTFLLNLSCKFFKCYNSWNIFTHSIFALSRNLLIHREFIKTPLFPRSLSLKL